MKTNPIKKKLRDGQPSFGTWLSLGDLYAARVLARLGFDWLTLDMEHQPIDWSTAAAIFGAIADAGCVPLVRVPEGNHYLIKRALDAGAWGIVAPMVNTVEQAKAVIAATKYPPVGNRSLGGGLHGLNFAATAGDYFKRANDEILVVLQTESPTGIANAEAIYSLPGVDAIFVGPVDLRANMRAADGTEATDAEFEAALDRIVAAGKKTRHAHRHARDECGRRPETRRPRHAIHCRGERTANDDGKGGRVFEDAKAGGDGERSSTVLT